MTILSASVGAGGKNHPHDVAPHFDKRVQFILANAKSPSTSALRGKPYLPKISAAFSQDFDLKHEGQGKFILASKKPVFVGQAAGAAATFFKKMVTGATATLRADVAYVQYALRHVTFQKAIGVSLEAGIIGTTTYR